MQISQPNPSAVPNPANSRAVQAPASVAPARSAQVAGNVAGSRGAAGAAGPPPPPPPDALAARVEAFGAGIAARLGAALAAAPEAQDGAFKGALQRFDQNLGRIRAGIEDGSLRGDDLTRAVQNSLALVRDDLAASAPQDGADAAPGAAAQASASTAVQAPSGATLGAAEASPSRGRFQNIMQGLSQRLAGLGKESDDADRQAGLQVAEQSFASATARIETAFFDNGDFDRGTFYGLLSASLGRLQQRLSDVFSGSQVQDATLYDAKTGTQSLSDGLRRVQFDRTV